MNRNDFLSILKDNLNAFPYEERESAIAYYNEFFDDAGAENEQAVIASLGDPRELAKTILKESGINSEQTYENQNANAVFTPPQTNKKVVNKIRLAGVSPKNRTNHEKAWSSVKIYGCSI